MKKILGALLLAYAITFSPVATMASTGYATAKTFTLTVAPPLVITNATALPGAVQGQAYSVQFGVTGGIAPYTWSVTNGSTLPAGLTLTAAGLLSGTPTTQGSYSFSITVTDGIQTAVLKVAIPAKK